jgi:hypothetical protein
VEECPHTVHSTRHSTGHVTAQDTGQTIQDTAQHTKSQLRALQVGRSSPKASPGAMEEFDPDDYGHLQFGAFGDDVPEVTASL